MLCPSCQREVSAADERCACGYNLAGALSSGTVIGGRYEILNLLGRGGMGVVYKARDRVLDETVALKLLRPDVTRAQAQARRFRAEIKLARKVRHRNVCGVHEYGEDGQLSYIAMEYVEGTDLKQELRRRGRIPPEEGFDIAVQCAMGLQAIHEVGIIHRDLKTPNIMRDTRAQVRLMDFGIAKESAATKASTAAGKIVGTPEYMSPEQAGGEKLDFRSDLYSLGIVAFEIFTGNRPFSSDSPVALIRMQIENDPPLDALIARGLPLSLRPVLKKVLSKKPHERFASAEELMRAFKDAEASWRASDLPDDTRLVSAGALALEPQPTPITATPTATPEPPPTSETLASLRQAVPDLQVVEPDDLRVADGELEVEHPLQPTDPQRHAEVDQQRSRERAIFQLKGEAETLAAEGRLDEAQRILQEALSLQPGRSDLQEALVRLGEQQARLAEEPRALAIAEAAAAVAALIDSGDLATARMELVRAGRELGSHESLKAVEARLRSQEEEAWRQREAKERADAVRRQEEEHQAREPQEETERLAWQRKEDEHLRGKEIRKQETAQKQISAPPPVASPPVGRPALEVWLAGVTALVLLAGVGFTLRALLGERAQHPAPAEIEPKQPRNAASTVTASPQLPITPSPEQSSSVEAVVKPVRRERGTKPKPSATRAWTPLRPSEENPSATPAPATAAPLVPHAQTLSEPSPVERTPASPPAVEAVTQPASPPAESGPVAPAEGMLQVVVQPWAEVSVDGVLVGITPLNKITLREGARVILLAHPAFAPLERTVRVRPGELTKLVVDLTREGTRK